MQEEQREELAIKTATNVNKRRLASDHPSRIPGFYELPISERQHILKSIANLSHSDIGALAQYGALNPELVDVFIENAIGTFPLPLGIATNFLVNGRDILIPMAVEETSVLAAASHGAKLARAGGGFQTSSTLPIGTGQIQLLTKRSVNYEEILSENRDKLLAIANEGHERLLARGGGAVGLSWRYFDEIQSLVLYLDVDTRDAMGANMINSMCERLGKYLPNLFQCEVGLCILTNLTDKRLARASCKVPSSALDSKLMNGKKLAQRIAAAYRFAAADIYRAATHNKGVMNGIDPVTIATGNDWRAVEAGAHAYCSRNGRYEPMTRWTCDENGDLEGFIELPIAIGTVGGVTKLHPGAKAAIKILGEPSAQGLAEIICAVGLAQNLSALRALASEGIQKGHMHLHQNNVALAKQGQK